METTINCINYLMEQCTDSRCKAQAYEDNPCGYCKAKNIVLYELCMRRKPYGRFENITKFMTEETKVLLDS